MANWIDDRRGVAGPRGPGSWRRCPSLSGAGAGRGGGIRRVGRGCRGDGGGARSRGRGGREEEGPGRSSSDALLGALRPEATRLFVGAPAPAVSPYEGVWRAADDGVQALLFVNPHSMEVERFMRACGLGRPEGTNEPLDHVATECELLEHLALRAAGAVPPEERPPAPTSPAARPRRPTTPSSRGTPARGCPASPSASPRSRASPSTATRPRCWARSSGRGGRFRATAPILVHVAAGF